MRNRRTRVSSLLSISAVAIAAAVLLLTGMIDLQTANGQVPGATYTGTTATGAEVEVVVNPDATALNSFRFGALQGQEGPPGIESPCGVGESFESQFEQGLPITNGSFTDTFASGSDPQADIVVNGTFSGSQVTGTIAMVFANNPDCNSGDISWSASTSAAPIAEATPAPTPTPPPPLAAVQTPAPTAKPAAALPGSGGFPAGSSSPADWMIPAGIGLSIVLAASLAWFAWYRRPENS